MIEYIDNKNELNKLQTWLAGHFVVGIDTETTGLDPYLDRVLLLQIGDPQTQFVLNVTKIPKDDILSILEILQEPERKNILHNAKFDYKMLYGTFGIKLKNMYCTLVANKLLTAGKVNVDNSLGGLADKYLSKKLDKEIREEFLTIPNENEVEFTEEQIRYAAADVEVLLPIFTKSKALLAEYDMEELYTLECLTVKITGDLELNGIYIDQTAWLNLEADAKAEQSRLANELHTIFKPHCETDIFGNLLAPAIKKKNKVGESLNFNSSAQMKFMLEIILGRSIPSTDKNVLKEINHISTKTLLEYREWAKRVTTYGAEFLKKNVHPITGRIHASFNQLGADTGRYSSDEPNMQNIPSLQKYRSPFCVSDTNYRIISADFSGQELRLLAELSREPKFLEALEKNMDLHSYSASLLFDKKYEDFFEYNEDGSVKMDAAGDPIVKSEMKKKYRNPAKSITFGLLYGMGPLKLSVQLGIELVEAKKLLAKYFETFPKIKIFMDSITKSVKANRYALSPLDKRRRDLTHIDWQHTGKAAHAINQAKNFPFQGCGASVTKLALVKIDEQIQKLKYDAKIVNVVHDEILVECHKDIAKEVSAVVEKCMVEAFNHYAPTIPMVVKPVIDTCWIH